MPRQHTVIEIRSKDTIACLASAITLLKELHDAFDTPFVLAISNTALSLIAIVQNVKRNKEECIQLMEDVHRVLYTIVNLHMTSGTAGTLPPAMLHHIGKFTETLHKIHTFVEAQQDSNKIKNFFRQSEMNILLKDCRTGLQQALEVFKMENDVSIFNNIAEMQKKTEIMQEKLLEMISAVSDGTVSDRSSSIYQVFDGVNSSNSFSMVPSKPKIFHGRESELQEIVEALTQEPARIAILGAGGMGKTSLARAALHHPDIATKHEHRFFVACDSATTSIDLAALVGSHLGLKPGKDLTKSVVEYFSRTPACLLILDNVETPWEPMTSRTAVEEFLSLLTDVPHLALIITMRGAERPAKVRWTRPFLPPLKPLTDDAARKTFMDITDNFYDNKEMNQLLSLTDNMPLAVDLIANLVDYEGCFNVLKRWETQKTSLLSDGYDKRSSLDTSISISLSSPRITSVPGAKDLLSLLSILPDGLSEIELVQSELPIIDILGCKAALLRTSLAYNDNRRLKSLVPIREHMQHFFPPSQPIIHALNKHFYLLLELYQKYRGAQPMAARLNQITSNLGNLQQVLLQGLKPDNPDIADAIKCTISLNNFRRINGHGRLALMDHVVASFPQPCDHRLEAQFITEVLTSYFQHNVVNPERLIAQAIDHFQHFNDPLLESRFYSCVGYYYCFGKDSMPAAMESLEKALSLSRECEDTNQECSVFNYIGRVKLRLGDFPGAQINAREAQKLAQLSANLYEEARALQTQASCFTENGNYKKSVSSLYRARELLNLCGLSGGTLDHDLMIGEGEVYLVKSEYVEALAINTSIMQKTSPEQDAFLHACALLNDSEINLMVYVVTPDVQRNLEAAKKIFSSVSSVSGVNCCQMTLAKFQLAEGNNQVAKAMFQQCLDSCWGTDAEVVFYCLERLADVSQWKPTEFDWASTYTMLYLVYSHKSRKNLALYKALQFLGDVFLANGDDQTAHSLFIVALDGFTYMDIHRSRAQCMLRLGDLAKNGGDLLKAEELWREARPLFERSSQTKDILQAEARLGNI